MNEPEFQPFTPKAFANSSPGVPQPWEDCVSRILTLKALATGLQTELRELLQAESQGCCNPELELANAFGVKVERVSAEFD